MTLNQLARVFHKAAVISRDINAVHHHRIAKRIVNRELGRIAGRLLRKVYL
jgi:Holliday junction resolvasome RuvABC ATP-dependent DNA helicase subunit